MNVSVPPGTEIYSKRIKVDGVSMADRKKKREKRSMTLEDLLAANGTDALIKNAAGRTKVTNEIEEGADNKIQQIVKMAMTKQPTQKHAFGTTVEEDPTNPLAAFMAMIQNGGMLTDNTYGGFGNQAPATAPANKNPYLVDDMNGALSKQIPAISDNASLDGVGKTDTNQSFATFANSMNKGYDASGTPAAAKTGEEGSGFGDMFGDFTLGDGIGLAGTLYSTFAPMKNTKANRAGDTPNINAFKEYGQDGLETLKKSKQYINQVRGEKLKDLELARTSSIKRNRNGARGINTLRALDLATDANVNNAQEQTYNSFAESMMAILGQEAGMENQIDGVVMQGEQNRDLADRQDRDNYFSQLAQDIATKGRGLQETGKDLNQKKENQVMMNLLNQLSAYGITVDSSGNLSNGKKKTK